MKRVLTFHGVVASKKNSKQIITNPRTGKPMIISSKKALQNAGAMIEQFAIMDMQCYTITRPSRVDIEIYEPDHRRRDLDNQATAILDALVSAEVINDDGIKTIIELSVRLGGFDKTDPRAIITIEEIDQ